MSSVQFSRVQLFATPWIAACQASLSITNSRSSRKLMSIRSVMPSSHLILCRPLLLLPPIPPSIRVFSNESTLRMRWPKYWSFSFSISPSSEHPGLISIGPCFYHQSHPQLAIVFALAPSLHSFWSYFSTDLQESIGHLPTWGVPLSVSYHFAFSYYSWGSQGKNTEVVCHSLLQWTTFCQTFPPWPARLGWPHTAWLSFIELDKAVIRVIRLTSFL